MRIEHADLSLVGDREDNQDRVTVAATDKAALLIVIDGMGGHSDGSRAADTALKSLLDSFHQTPLPMFDPHRLPAHGAEQGARRSGAARQRPEHRCAAARHHRDLPGAGRRRLLGARRRQPRVPHPPGQDRAARTRDHSHVELLLREGKITEDEVPTHPMRNFVECCLGGDPAIPEMTISGRHVLLPGDVLLLCTDGIWANLRDTDIAGFFRDDTQELRAWLEALGRRAVQASAPFSDNSTAAVLRWLGD